MKFGKPLPARQETLVRLIEAARRRIFNAAT